MLGPAGRGQVGGVGMGRSLCLADDPFMLERWCSCMLKPCSHPDLGPLAERHRAFTCTGSSRALCSILLWRFAAETI